MVRNKSNLNNFPKKEESVDLSNKSFSSPPAVIECKKRSSYTALDIVKILLRERAMKQTDLADKIGMSRQALHNYLRGEWAVPTQIKIKVAKALEVDSSVIWDLEAKE